MRAENVVAFAAGVVFAIGLGISGMLRPEVILAFLDVGGNWNPSLLVVMATAVPLYMAAFLLARRRGRSLLRGTLELPPERPVDARLVFGAAVFGVGWGLAGLCPGPALTVASVRPSFLAFLAALVAGVFAGEIVRTRLTGTPARK